MYIAHRLLEINQDGNKTVTDTRYDMRKCTDSDFNNSDYERNFWESSKDYYSINCIDDPNNSLSLRGPGSFDDLDRNKIVSKMNVKIKICQNSSTKAENETCSTREEIDDWLEGK